MEVAVDDVSNGLLSDLTAELGYERNYGRRFGVCIDDQEIFRILENCGVAVEDRRGLRDGVVYIVGNLLDREERRQV